MKKFFLTVSTFFLTSSLFALPGIIHTIPDQSGQFIYYRDYTFEKESYFGIVYYDISTIGVRYYSPAKTDENPLIPAKDIQILFTFDPQKKYIELTGERFITPIHPEDTDIINYLHDMLYELNSRRGKAGIIESSLSLNDDFMQFGGEVTINYDSQVPLFNVRSILNEKGQPVFKLITAGQLKSSEDKSFSSFQGLPVKTLDNTHSLKLNKKSSSMNVAYSKNETVSQSIKLDNRWKAQAENLFFLENVAVLALDVIDLNQLESQNEKDLFIKNLERKFTLGTDYSYPYSETTVVNSKEPSKIIENTFFNDVSKSFTRDFKILTEVDENTFAVLTLTVFQNPYVTNKKYFNKILDSYKVTKN